MKEWELKGKQDDDDDEETIEKDIQFVYNDASFETIQQFGNRETIPEEEGGCTPISN